MSNYNAILIILSCLTLFCCRTEIGTKEDNQHTNSLINETSPYLLQHAYNPVDWRIWSEKALEEAKDQKKLVVVSIGYSSCHWCHVMERETFEDEAVAQIMNDDYINIKVDREERPDIDFIYQRALELITGSGGWPLNAIVLPSGKPVYLGTYHTKEQWSKLLSVFNISYKNDSEKMEDYANDLAQGIQSTSLIEPAKDFSAITKQALNEVVNNWKQNWDSEWGGEKGIEKFIIPYKLEFLLDYSILTGDQSARSFVKNTLDKIAVGGIYDHVGGGFFRYSTDQYWKVPHFEKMLYDNAQLLSLYSKAYNVFNEPSYKKIVIETFSFLEREMKSPEGGYYAAIDSETNGEEGEFYLWSGNELKLLLGEDFQLFSKYYNLNKEELLNNEKIVLCNPSENKTFANQNSISLSKLISFKSKWKKQLFDHRNSRVYPNVDDKILTSWNALLINGLLEGFKNIGEKEFLIKAENTFEFIVANSLKGKELAHSYKNGSENSESFLDDYVLMVNAALNLYKVTLKVKYLKFAQQLNEIALTQFEDKDSDFFKYTKNDKLISKIIKTVDGFWPSPNSVLARNLFVLGHIQYDKEFLKKSNKMLSSMVSSLKNFPRNYANWNSLLLNNTYPYYEIAVVGKNASSLVEGMNREYIPNILLVGTTEPSDLPLFKDRFNDDATYIYVCQNNTCKLPVQSLAEVVEQLKNY